MAFHLPVEHIFRITIEAHDEPGHDFDPVLLNEALGAAACRRSEPGAFRLGESPFPPFEAANTCIDCTGAIPSQWIETQWIGYCDQQV